MSVRYRDPNDTQGALKDSNRKGLQDVTQTGLSQSALQSDADSIIGDLNTNNFTAAWNTALGTSKAYGTNYNSGTTDPLLAAMESSTGLKQLDPSKQWNNTEINQYYSALGNTKTYNGTQTDGSSLGQNPYSLWGSGADLTNGHDASVNESTTGDNSAPDVERFAGARPSPSFLSKYGGTIAALAIGAVTAGTGLAGMALAAGADAAGTAGVIGAGAALGAGTGALGGALTGGNIGKDALMGAIGGGIGTAASGLASNITGGTGLEGAAGSVAAKVGTNLATGAIGQDLYGGSTGNPATNASGSVGSNSYENGSVSSGGVTASPGGSNDMMSNLGNLNLGQLLQGGAGLLGAGLSVKSAGQIGQMQQNAYTTAGNAANQGPFNVSSSSGLGGTFGNNSAQINYGNMTGAQNQFAQFANQQSGYANALKGQNPAAVTQAGNAAQAAITSGIGNSGYAAQGGKDVLNAGLNQINNPLIAQSNKQASSLLGSAGANYQSAYNTSLQSQLAALNPAIQQQSNALLNSNFERGQSGTSGGALNVQALQNSFNQADLQAQGNAVSQANALMGTTYNAANTASGIATNQQASGTNMFNVGQNAYLSGSNNAATLGQAGVGLQQNLASYAPQLAGMYNTNAVNATQGAGAINSQGLQNANFGLSLGANQATQMNNAAKTQGQIGNQYNGGQTGALGSAFSSLGGLLGGGNSAYSGLLGSIFGTNKSTAANGTASALGGLGGTALGGLAGYNPVSTTYGAPGINGDVSGGVDSSGIPTDLAMPGGSVSGGDYGALTDPSYNPWGGSY